MNKHTHKYEILKELWSTCKICNKTLIEIKKDYGGGNKYFSQAFLYHIKSHNITKEQYFEEILGLERPICKCGICNKKVNVCRFGSILHWAEYKCGRYEGQIAWSEKAKETRKGAGNPMFQKPAWNKGLGLENPIIAASAAKRRGAITPPEVRAKQSIARRNSPFQQRHTGPHSQETKDFLRLNTLRLIKEGVFKQTKSKCHIAMCKIVEELGFIFEEEKIVSHFSYDLYLIDYDVYIEVDGDYWHSNPRKYPNGPISKTQKINYSRDCSKNKYCKNHNMNLIRFWEYDILNTPDVIKEKLLCYLKELSQLEKSDQDQR